VLCRAGRAVHTTKNIQQFPRATAPAGWVNKGRLDLLILSKRFEKPPVGFLHGALDAAMHSANSVRMSQAFLSAQLELTRTVSPCELKQTT
jgi:hypothetical protein